MYILRSSLNRTEIQIEIKSHIFVPPSSSVIQNQITEHFDFAG